MDRVAQKYLSKYEFYLMKNATSNTAILVLDNTNMLSLAAAVDPMRAANRMSGKPLFDWQFFTATGAPVQLTSGLTVAAAPIAKLDRCDMLIVVASFDTRPQATPALLASLRRIAKTGAMIAGLDGGPWLLARAGLLDNHTATIHWEDLERFANQFPAVTVLPDRFRIDRDRLTSAGALPGLDMMLHLIAQRFDQQLATQVAGAFIHDAPHHAHRPQSRAGGNPAHSTLTAKASALMEQNLDAPLPIPTIAKHCKLSARALELQFKARLGTTPKAHYMSLRLTEARRLVTTTDLPLFDIALATGFASQSSFSRAFRQAYGQAARDLRKPPASFL
jgi:transcriptional regulator GlxA family with amidase domain